MQIKRVNCFSKHKVVFGVKTDIAGVHFHIDPGTDVGDYPFGSGMPPLCGIEFHRANPDGQDCWMIGKCDHDGSSLAALECFLPTYRQCNETGDFEPLWNQLTYWLRRELIEADEARDCATV
jgi:hypothetical protein